ncbi:MAG: sugar synthetase, partial [Halanaerobiales bacterium]
QVTDLALTIPGTNNLELAYFGTPMIVLLPLNKPEDIPLEGVVGLIGEIPYLGKLLKQKLVPKIAARTDYVALINIIAEKRIAPEIRGIISPEDLVERVNYYLENKKELKAMQPRLKEAAGSKGAVDRLRRIVEETIIDYY